MFVRIDYKILVVVGTIVSLGLATMLLFYTDREESTILAQNRRALVNLIDSTEKGLNTLMLSGYGNAGPVFAESLESVSREIDLQVLRTNGLPAFADNRTIRTVNNLLGYQQFELRDKESLALTRQVDLGALGRALESGEVTEYIDVTSDGERLMTLLSPIRNAPACERCHALGERFNGVIKLTTSLKSVDDDIASSRNQSLVIMFVTVVVIMITVGLFLRRTVIPPIRAITRAMRRAARGELKQEIPVPAQAELGTMARSFNYMTRELEAIYQGLERERNKLTTIILGAQEGIVLTDSDGRVVLVNPAAEPLLEKGSEEIIRGGLPGLFDAPEWVEQRLAAASDGHVSDSLHYRGRMLGVQLGRIANDHGETIGSAALIRDITQQYRLQQRLRNQSLTDPLTALHNRRHFDACLASEVARARRYGHALSVVIFDIDHFKQFNDDHGHDQGDRVLQGVAETARNTFRELDIVCRYGGEEFAVLMPDADVARAYEQAEWVRKTIEQLRIDGLSVTCSFGVAQFEAERHDGGQALVGDADKALYVAKNDGRNLVRLGSVP